MSDRERIENCYRRMYSGMIEKDCEDLMDVLDEAFVLVHMTGMRQSKEAFIRAVEDGTLNYFSAEHQRIDVTIHQGTAELRGRSAVNAAVFGGGRHTWRLQLDLRLAQKDGEWKIVEAKASTY